MRRSHASPILLYCFFSLIVGARHTILAQQSPQSPEKERGIELYRKGDFSGAVEALQEAVKKQESDPDAWYYLGLSLRDAGKIKDARKVFEKTLSLRPNFAPGYAAMAYTCLLDGDNKGAVKNAERALAIDPKNFESHCIMAVLADDGVIKHIMVLQPLSHGLTEQAIMAARKIRFTPAARDGKPISIIVTLEYTFNPY